MRAHQNSRLARFRAQRIANRQLGKQRIPKQAGDLDCRDVALHIFAQWKEYHLDASYREADRVICIRRNGQLEIRVREIPRGRRFNE